MEFRQEKTLCRAKQDKHVNGYDGASEGPEFKYCSQNSQSDFKCAESSMQIPDVYSPLKSRGTAYTKTACFK